MRSVEPKGFANSSPLHIPLKENGVAERKNPFLVEMVCYVLLDFRMLLTVNRLPTKLLRETPFALWNALWKPDIKHPRCLGHMRTWAKKRSKISQAVIRRVLLAPWGIPNHGRKQRKVDCHWLQVPVQGWSCEPPNFNREVSLISLQTSGTASSSEGLVIHEDKSDELFFRRFEITTMLRC